MLLPKCKIIGSQFSWITIIRLRSRILGMLYILKSEEIMCLFLQFSLVCDNAWKGAFIICAGMVGKLFAGLSGKISDRYFTQSKVNM